MSGAAAAAAAAAVTRNRRHQGQDIMQQMFPSGAPLIMKITDQSDMPSVVGTEFHADVMRGQSIQESNAHFRLAGLVPYSDPRIVAFIRCIHLGDPSRPPLTVRFYIPLIGAVID